MNNRQDLIKCYKCHVYRHKDKYLKSISNSDGSTTLKPMSICSNCRDTFNKELQDANVRICRSCKKRLPIHLFIRQEAKDEDGNIIDKAITFSNCIDCRRDYVQKMRDASTV